MFTEIVPVKGSLCCTSANFSKYRFCFLIYVCERSRWIWIKLPLLRLRQSIAVPAFSTLSLSVALFLWQVVWWSLLNFVQTSVSVGRKSRHVGLDQRDLGSLEDALSGTQSSLNVSRPLSKLIANRGMTVKAESSGVVSFRSLYFVFSSFVIFFFLIYLSRLPRLVLKSRLSSPSVNCFLLDSSLMLK